MNNFWYFTANFLDALPSIFLALYPYRHNLKVPYKTAIGFYIFFTFIHSLGLVYIYSLPNYDLDLMVLYRCTKVAPFLPVYLYLTQPNYGKSLFIYAMQLPYVCLIITLSSYFFTMLGLSHTPTYMYSSIIRMIIIGITFPILLKFYQLIFAENRPLISPKIWNLAAPIAITQAAVSLLTIRNDYELVGISLSNLLGRCLLFLSSIALCFIVLEIMRYSQEDSMLRQENAQNSLLLEAQTTQYQELTSSLKKTSRLRHDLRHQLLTLKLLLTQKNYHKAELYIAEALKDFDSNTALKHCYCENNTCNALLNYYNQKAANARIKINTNFQLSEEASISSVDISILLSNALENCLQACALLPEEERFITVSGQEKYGRLSLIIKNSYNGCHARTAVGFLSQKRDFKALGVGLSSIKAIVQKYHGDLQITPDNKTFSLACILEC